VKKILVYIYTVLQIPLMLLKLLVECLRLIVIYANYTVTKKQNRIIGKNLVSLTGQDDDREQTIKEIISAWAYSHNLSIAKDRYEFEQTPEGRQVVSKHPDRHLYAVKRPNRKENLKRIENVLWAMPDERLKKMQQVARDFEHKLS